MPPRSPSPPQTCPLPSAPTAATSPSTRKTLQAIAALAHVLLAERRPADAEALLAPALAAHPSDPTLTALLARADLASDDPAKTAQAAPLLEKLHAANPQDANIARLLARVYLDTDHPDQADPLYAALISAQSQAGENPDPTLLDDRAEALLRLHRPGAAETLLKQAVANPAAFPNAAALGDAATHLAFAAAEIDDPTDHLAGARSACYSPATLALDPLSGGNGERHTASERQGHRPLPAVPHGGRHRLSRSGSAGAPTARRPRPRK